MASTSDTKATETRPGTISDALTAFEAQTAKLPAGPTPDPNVAIAYALGWAVGDALTCAKYQAFEHLTQVPGLGAPSDQWNLLVNQITSRCGNLNNHLKNTHANFDLSAELKIAASLLLGPDPGDVKTAVGGKNTAAMELHTGILRVLWSVSSPLVKSYQLGQEMEQMCAAPIAEPSTTVSASVQAHDAGVHGLLMALASKLPANAAHATDNSLRLWSASLSAGGQESPGDLLRQGRRWHDVLAGDVSGKDGLRITDYVAAADSVAGKLWQTARQVAARFKVLLIAAVLVVAGGVVLIFFGTKGTIGAGITAVLAAFGLTWKGIGEFFGRAAAKGEEQLWDAEIDWAIAYRFTVLRNPPADDQLKPRSKESAIDRPTKEHLRRYKQWKKNWPDILQESQPLAAPHHFGSGGGGRTDAGRGNDQLQLAQDSSRGIFRADAYLGDLSSAPSNRRRSLARRAAALGAACVAAAGSGAATVLAGAAPTLSLAVSLGVLAAATATLEGAVIVSERRSQDQSREQAVDPWGQAAGGGAAIGVRDRTQLGSTNERSGAAYGGDRGQGDDGAGGTGEPPLPPGGATSTGGRPPRQRYLKGRYPESIPVGELFSLRASIVLAAGPSSVALKLFDVPPEGRDVRIEVDAPSLRVLGDRLLTVHVPPDGDSEPVMFELRADRPGVHKVSIWAWIGGTYLGDLRVDITAERDHLAGSHRDVVAPITTEPTEGAVSLVVRFDPRQNAYRFEFRDEDNPDEVTANLAYEPGPRVERLVARLDDLAKGRSGLSAGQARNYLVQSGAGLWDELVPRDLRQQFWDRQHRIRQLTILADKDVVPWELLYPMDPGRDAGFLVEQFPVTRAIFGRRSARRLSLWPARFVLPGGPLREAQDEIDAMRRLLDPGQPPEKVISALMPLQDLIASGDFGLLHFACHGTYDPVGGSSIKLDNVQFTPHDMSTAAINKVLAGSAPTVFINACRSAGLSATYNRLDGWASKFLEAGAGAFIGTLWAVSDGAAREFAQELYGRLRAGSSLGEAVKCARTVAATELDDPTWLAYTVYGDPRATLSQQRP